MREGKELAAAIAASLESESKSTQLAASTTPKVAETVDYNWYNWIIGLN